MRDVRSALARAFIRANGVEESPEVTVLKMSSRSTSSPFSSGPTEEVYDQNITVPCIYSEMPEVITSNNNLTTQQVMYIMVSESAIDDITLTDRLIFRKIRYRPVDRQKLFGFIRVRAVKE